MYAYPIESGPFVTYRAKCEVHLPTGQTFTQVSSVRTLDPDPEGAARIITQRLQGLYGQDARVSVLAISQED